MTSDSTFFPLAEFSLVNSNFSSSRRVHGTVYGIQTVAFPQSLERMSGEKTFAIHRTLSMIISFNINLACGHDARLF